MRDAATMMSHGEAAGHRPEASRILLRIGEWVIYLPALAAVWPRSVPMRGDDFGYYQSVVDTIQRGAPSASEWLEPYNLVLPFLAAVVWRGTENFHAATFGLLGVLAIANFVLLRR